MTDTVRRVAYSPRPGRRLPSQRHQRLRAVFASLGWRSMELKAKWRLTCAAWRGRRPPYRNTISEQRGSEVRDSGDLGVVATHSCTPDPNSGHNASFRRLKHDWPFDVLEIEETFGTARWIARAVAAPVVVRLHGPWFVNGSALGVPRDAAFHARVAAEGKAIASAAAVSTPCRDVLERVHPPIWADAA